MNEEKNRLQSETDAYLKKIRKTVDASRNLVESARLRIQETDRLIEKQGFTREQLMNVNFTKAQQDAVNNELKRLGFSEISDEEFDAMKKTDLSEHSFVYGREAGSNFTAGDADGTIENRKRKFNVMMQRFRM